MSIESTFRKLVNQKIISDDDLKDENYSSAYSERFQSIIDFDLKNIELNMTQHSLCFSKETEIRIAQIDKKWGAGLNWLRFYYNYSSNSFNDWKAYNKEEKHDSEIAEIKCVLHYINGKAFYLTAEIICLLENGFPEGAIARFRSLHELWAIGEFISEDTKEVATAYLNSVSDKNENNSDDHYKWAKVSKRFSDKNPTISNIISEAMNTFVKKTDGNISKTKLWKIQTDPNIFIHPSAKGVCYLINPENNDVRIGGTNTGLAHPAINTLIWLYNINRLYLNTTSNVYTELLKKMLYDINEKAQSVFQKIESESII
ncbi:DUF5677 domain-containing protein [Methanimicrococcus stummii]|uniref:DUF5677 domain-containing protein n=1 Tax=Methanimicrococcus stummii TaxID=3028294 RepID=UPI00292F242A|nr:DUF5677 domain-containing protein [Methanimicrococcus sp. Es2]